MLYHWAAVVTLLPSFMRKAGSAARADTRHKSRSFLFKSFTLIAPLLCRHGLDDDVSPKLIMTLAAQRWRGAISTGMRTPKGPECAAAVRELSCGAG